MSDMGSPALIHQPPRKDQAIVAFDFDGTLTVSDSFTRLLRWRAGAGSATEATGVLPARR